MLVNARGRDPLIAHPRLTRIIRKARSWTLANPIITVVIACFILSAAYFALGVHLRQARAIAIADAIFGGIIASVATTSIVQRIYLKRTAHAVRRWLRFGHRDVWVIPTTLEHPAENRYYPQPYYVVPPFDAHATGVLTEVLRHAQYRYPQRHTLGSHVYDPALLKDNIVTICLPSRNQYTRILLGVFHELYELKQSRVIATSVETVGSGSI
jgi:hypothetical protein